MEQTKMQLLLEIQLINSADIWA